MADLTRLGLICSCQTQIHPSGRSAIQLQIKTILNCVQRFVGFVYSDVRMHVGRNGRPESIEITVQPHGGIRGRCSKCRRPAPGTRGCPGCG